MLDPFNSCFCKSCALLDTWLWKHKVGWRFCTISGSDKVKQAVFKKTTKMVWYAILAKTNWFQILTGLEILWWVNPLSFVFGRTTEGNTPRKTWETNVKKGSCVLCINNLKCKGIQSKSRIFLSLKWISQYIKPNRAAAW